MDHDSDEEQHGSHYRDYPSQAVTPTRIIFLKMSDEREGDQHRDDEPTVVQPNFDAEDTTQLNLRLHRNKYYTKTEKELRIHTDEHRSDPCSSV